MSFDPLLIVMSIPGVLMGFTFHEFAHAYVATLFGDDTPRLQGRVTLSPLAHLDPLGTILLLIGGFGWAKPVQVNTRKLRPRVWGDIAVSLAGVTMNFLLALLFYAAAVLYVKFTYNRPGYNDVLTQTLLMTVRIQVILVGFNVIPVPPLDGFHVLRYALPRALDGVVDLLQRYGTFLLILFFVGTYQLGWSPLDPIYNGITWAVKTLVHAVPGMTI